MYHIVSYAYGRFETKFWKWKYNFMMVLLMNAVMGWRHGDINQRGVLCFGIGLREREVWRRRRRRRVRTRISGVEEEESKLASRGRRRRVWTRISGEEEEGSGLESREKKKKGLDYNIGRRRRRVRTRIAGREEERPEVESRGEDDSDKVARDAALQPEDRSEFTGKSGSKLLVHPNHQPSIFPSIKNIT